MKKPFRISEIKLDNILYSNPVIKDDKTNILLKYNSNDKKQQFLIQTPELVSISKPKLNKDVYEINVGLQTKSSKKIANLLKFIENLDNKIESLGKNNNEWFNGNNAIYKKLVRSDPNYPNGILKLKVKKNNIPKYLKVTKNKQAENGLLEEINDASKIKLVIDIFGLWIRKRNNSYYYGIYLKPVLIDYREEIVEDISFIEDSDSDNENINEILDTEFEQQYDNTETSVMNLNNNLKIDHSLTENVDSAINSINLTIEDINNMSDKIKVSSNNISEKEDTDNTGNTDLTENTENTDNTDNINNIMKRDSTSDSSVNSQNNFIEDSDSDENIGINIIGNYDNSNYKKDEVNSSSSAEEINNFHLTSEAIDKNL